MKKEIKNQYTIAKIHKVFQNANFHYSGWVDEQLDQIIEKVRADGITGIQV